MPAVFVAIAVSTASLGATSNLTYLDTYSAGLTYPARLAAAPGGGIYVTDPPLNQVVQYDSAGAVVNTYSIPQGPVGIATHPDSRVFISRSDGSIGIYDAAFAFLGTVNPAPLTLTGPNDLAFYPSALELYAVDSGSHRVLVFTESVPGTWTLGRSWGMEGVGLGQFAAPQSIALDTVEGRVIVTDADNFRVQVFDITGTLLFKFGYRMLFLAGSDTAWFARSEGVGIDACGNIYIADALMGTLRVFTGLGVEINGMHVPSVGYGTAAGKLRVPCDVLIEGDTLYVANTNNGTVEVFDVACTLAATAGEVAGRTETTEKTSRVERSGRGKPSAAVVKGLPDSPLDVIAAIDDGEYRHELDLNQDQVLNRADIDLAVMAFGMGTTQGFLDVTAEAHPPLDAPHILDLPNRCGRCHSLDGAPGGMLTAAGQENLCQSCHSAGKIAGSAWIGAGDLENSHPWGVAADAGISDGPPADSDLALHLDNGDIRCGTCHDPHNSAEDMDYLRHKLYEDTVANVGGVETPMVSMDPTLCGECHTDIVDQWHVAGHSHEDADPWIHYDWSLASRSACRKCHSGFGYIDFNNGVLDGAQQRGTLRVADCLVCHSTHGASQDGMLLRAYDTVTMPGNITLNGVGTAASCMVCHNGRYAPSDPGFTPHYLLGGAMLAGVNGITTFAGISYSVLSSQHTDLLNTGGLTCATCHMAAGPVTGDPGAGKVGGHTFNMKVHDPGDPDVGFENVASACGGCHTGLMTFNRTAGGDYDGDGTTEGVQDETQGLLDIVVVEIVAKGATKLANHPYWYTRVCAGGGNNGGGCSTNAQCPGGGVCTDIPDKALVEDAIWNWEFVDNSSDLGVKNTGYAVGLLQVAYEGLTGNPVPGAAYRYSVAP